MSLSKCMKVFSFQDCFDSPWKALGVCSLVANPRWGGQMFSWQLWHQSLGWENLEWENALIRISSMTSCTPLNVSNSISHSCKASNPFSKQCGCDIRQQHLKTKLEKPQAGFEEHPQSHSRYVTEHINLAFISLSLFHLQKDITKKCMWHREWRHVS